MRISLRRSSSTLSDLHAELTSRRLPILYDYLSPTPAHLLSTTLLDFLPPIFASSYLRLSSINQPTSTLSPLLPSAAGKSNTLPPAYHLIYFPPLTPSSALLPDGTDPLQSPGPEFPRRMWAGGSLAFNPGLLGLRLNAQRAACVERIVDVNIKGKEGDEKIFVGLERNVGVVNEKWGEDEVRRKLGAERADGDDAWGEVEALRERRNIVFMRESKNRADTGERKILTASHSPTFSRTITPTPNLLLRYSALTFNAHAIHLDPHYCRNVEHHRNLLVHGPLSFTLMMTLLNIHLKERGAGGIKEIEYRNLAPLYAEEEMKICGRQMETSGKVEDKYEIWIEGLDGGMCVRGVAKVVS
ncbi:MAG: hypothetical protein M1820_005430 [Bogoriella megaspora]|nr:MAG: hypothetical protein M1820_005430 [Bogoriella megaspora]